MHIVKCCSCKFRSNTYRFSLETAGDIVSVKLATICTLTILLWSHEAKAQEISDVRAFMAKNFGAICHFKINEADSVHYLCGKKFNKNISFHYSVAISYLPYSDAKNSLSESQSREPKVGEYVYPNRDIEKRILISDIANLKINNIDVYYKTKLSQGTKYKFKAYDYGTTALLNNRGKLWFVHASVRTDCTSGEDSEACAADVQSTRSALENLGRTNRSRLLTFFR